MDCLTPTSGAVRVVFIGILPDGKLKLHLVREYEGNTEVWKFPGGMIEGRETPIEAMFREYFQETGKKLEGKLNQSSPYIEVLRPSNDGRGMHFIRVYLVIEEIFSTTIGTRLGTTIDPDILENKWVNLSRLPSNRFPIKGAELAWNHWGYLRKIFEHPYCQDLLESDGLDENRRNGLLESWEKYGNLKVT